jgi:hypothetical protein
MEWSKMANETIKPEPKFKIGQVVMIQHLRKAMPFKILAVTYEDDGWYYKWNRNNYASEAMIRELTKVEKGE